MANSRLALCVFLAAAATTLKGVNCGLSQSYQAPGITTGGVAGGSSFGGLGGSLGSSLLSGSTSRGSVFGSGLLTGGYGSSILGTGSLTGLGVGGSTLGNLGTAYNNGLAGSSGGIVSGLGSLTNTGNLVNTGFGSVTGGNLAGNIGVFPARPRPVIPILTDQREGPYANGVYSFNYATGNGIVRQEQGYPEGGMVSQRGAWSFTHPDGTPTTVNFVADANGFRVDSNRVPPLPPHAIAQIEKARLEDAVAATSVIGSQFPGSGLNLIGSGSQFTGTQSLISNSGLQIPTYGSQFPSGLGSGSLLAGSGSLLSGLGTLSTGSGSTLLPATTQTQGTRYGLP